MTPRTALVCCALSSCFGVLVGVSLDGLRTSGRVHAQGPTLVEANKLYADLASKNGSLVEAGETLAKVSRLTTPTVVHIQSEHRNQRGGTVEETGSGVLVKSDRVAGTFVATNRHVIAGAPLSSISIRLSDGRELHPVRVLSDKATDVAVMQVEGDDLPVARWGDSDAVDIGHIVLAMGSPFGLSQSVTFGIISAKGRRSLRLGAGEDVINQNFLQTDAAINPGNSGGPLIDLRGTVVGINTAIASNSGGNDGIGFSIPSRLVRRVIDELLTNGRVQRAYLGVRLDSDFTVDTAKRLKLDRNRGARIVEVYPNTPASRAGLQFDDVVLRFEGVEVLDENHLINLVSLTPVDRRPQVVVQRGGKPITVPVQLADRTELEDQSRKSPAKPGVGVPVEPMGLTVHRLDQEVAGRLGYAPTSQGLLVLRIDERSPLSEHLRLYDLIQEVARVPVNSVDDLLSVLEANKGRDALPVRVLRRTEGRVESRIVLWNR